mgnify:CR=1 FL=1
MTNMNNRQLAQLLSALGAWCFEVDRGVEFFFDQRRFLENPGEEPVIGFDCEEQKECGLKKERMLANILSIWQNIQEPKVPNTLGTGNQVPISEAFMEQTKVFE